MTAKSGEVELKDKNIENKPEATSSEISVTLEEDKTLKELISLELAEATLKSLSFNTKKARCSSCGMTYYEDFEDFKSHKLTEGVLSRLKQIKQFKLTKVQDARSLKITLNTRNQK